MTNPRHFLNLTDASREELVALLDAAAALKADRACFGERPLAGRTLLLVFHKASTRTRVSFQVGMYQLGGLAIELRADEIQINRGETVEDTARVLSRYADAAVIRTFSQEYLARWAAASAIPIVNGLTDLHHPCQVLADLLTIREAGIALDGCRLAYVGDGNNMLHSLVAACTRFGIELTMGVPAGYDPDPAVLAAAAAEGYRGPAPRLVRDPREAVAGADVIYTDVWTSMGQEAEREKRLAAFAGYGITPQLLEAAGPQARVMHCLPAHRGEEISAEVLEGPRSIVFPQAENRLHVQKALLLFLLGGGRLPARD